MAGQFRENFIKPFQKVTLPNGEKRKRSSKWPKCRAEHLEENPSCANCGKTVKFLRNYRMQVHHKVPFSRQPEWELLKKNLITLCGNPRCHLDKGHLGNFKSFNVDVVEDCAAWLKKYKERP